MVNFIFEDQIEHACKMAEVHSTIEAFITHAMPNKDVSAVVDAADGAGLARKVARLVPVICIKG